jgi:four helix bundle protein
MGGGADGLGRWAVERWLTGFSTIPFMKRYQRLEAWQAAHQLVLLTYRVTKSFPREELYGLTSQARRAAFSVAANIAEGSAKKGPREFRRYLDIAVGSLAELAYIFQLVKDLDLIEPAKWSELDQAREQAGRLTWGLYRSVRGLIGGWADGRLNGG